MGLEKHPEKMPLKKKLEGKTFKQKLGYFWDYHKWKVILPVLVMVVIVSFISTYKEETKPLTLYIAILNGADTIGAEIKFSEEYPKVYGIDTKAEPVKVESGMVYPKTMDESDVVTGTTVASMQKYQGMLINGDMDVTIATDWAVDEYAKSDAFRDLGELLPEGLKERVKDRFYYAQDSTGKRIPVGICLNSDKWGTYYEAAKPVLAVSSYSGRQENAVRFIEWITNEDVN